MATTRVNIKINKNYDNYIGRPSEFGNPFSHLNNTLAVFKVAGRDEAVDSYEKYIRKRIKEEPDLLNKILKMKDTVLGCFCNLDQKCHGDVLIKLIEEYSNEK